VRIACPIFDRPTELSGIAAAEVDARTLEPRVPLLDPSIVAFVVDGAQRTLGARPTLPPDLAPEQVQLAIEQARIEDAVVQVGASAGAVAPVEGTNWAVAYLPGSTRPSAQDINSRRAAVFLTSCVVLVLAIAIMLVVQMSLRPVNALSAGARMLGSGDLSFRLPPAEVSEFRPVVDGFNRMAAQLQSLRDQLLAYTR
jgi:methyl-accepting chemotaxis protein